MFESHLKDHVTKVCQYLPVVQILTDYISYDKFNCQ